MKDTTHIGNVAETAILAALVRNNYNISIPFGSISDYDLVAEKTGKFYRIQCKTGQLLGDFIRFRPCTVLRSGGTRDYKGRADLFGIYAGGHVYLVPVVMCGISICHLRLNKPKNNQQKHIIMANTYLLK